MKRYIVLIGILCLSGVITLKAQERNQGIIWSSLRVGIYGKGRYQYQRNRSGAIPHVRFVR